jgi:cation diffusion facilitator CzcD-associated flavoprotein CzcO
VRVAIIGAGVAGLATAKVLRQVGHEVVVYDRTPDVGGVWSATRRYPGVTTQSPRDTYALSDFPMPSDYPEWPSGAQVQAYLASYATHFGLDADLRLNTEVTATQPRTDRPGWTLHLRNCLDGGWFEDDVDHLVIANGVFSQPLVPDFEGLDDFTAAGGRLCSAGDVHDSESARGAHAVVVGYGKTSCDVAFALSESAAETHVVARQLLWKVPKKIAGFLNFKFLLLTRMGEALFRWQHPRGLEKFLHGPGNRLRRRMLNSVGSVSVRQYRLKELDLLPSGTMEGIVRGAIGLVTDGFFDRVGEGRIVVHRDRTIKRLLEKDGVPYAELSDGVLLRADLVVCATGYTQGVEFLDPARQRQLLDEAGNFQLYRQVLPLDLPDLSFAGYNSSFFSPLNAEMAAVWIAAHLGGVLDLPDPQAMRAQVEGRIAFMDQATGGHHQHGTKVIPFSMHNVDEVLNDLDLNIGRLTRARHWLEPVNPAAYAGVITRLQHRLADGSGRPVTPPGRSGHD